MLSGTTIRHGDISRDVTAHDCVPYCLCGLEPHTVPLPYHRRSVFPIMTTDSTSDDEISSADDFEAALGEVILAALQNDIDLRGTWEYRTDGETPDLEVMVVELAP